LEVLQKTKTEYDKAIAKGLDHQEDFNSQLLAHEEKLKRLLAERNERLKSQTF